MLMSTIISLHGSPSLVCRAQDHFGPSLACDVCTKLMDLIELHFKAENFKDPVVYVPQGPLYHCFKFWSQLNKIPISNDPKAVTHSLCLWDGDPGNTVTGIGKNIILCNVGLKKVKFKKARKLKPKQPKTQTIKTRKVKIG